MCGTDCQKSNTLFLSQDILAVTVLALLGQ